MQKTLDAILAENGRLNNELRSLIAAVPPGELPARPGDEGWSVADLLEHIAIVENGSIRICGRLLKKAQAAEKRSSGGIRLSENYLKGGESLRNMKVEAPEMVRPTGQRSIEESFEMIAENARNLEEMGPLFEAHLADEFTFPHPYLGELSAAEWLDLVPEHKSRHLEQIKRLVSEF